MIRLTEKSPVTGSTPPALGSTVRPVRLPGSVNDDAPVAVVTCSRTG